MERIVRLQELPNVKIHRLPFIERGDSYTDAELNKATDAYILTTLLLQDIKFLADGWDHMTIGMEALAFGATGNRLAELAGYQYLLRTQFLLNIPRENIHLYSPSTIKATAAKGKPDKNAMVNAFLGNAEKDPLLQSDPLFLELTNNTTFYQNKNEWYHPVDDYIDAYWIIQTILRLQSKS